MSHTPGPWEFRKAGVSVSEMAHLGIETARPYPDHVVKVDTDEKGRKRTAFVCECNSTTLPNEANARLIAAAPDLLKIVHDLVEWAEKSVSPSARMWNYEEAAHCIAKAEGNAPEEEEKSR